MKKAIIIGASSGIGKELAIVLAKNGYEIGLMARRTELLEALKNEIPTKTHVGHIDLSKLPETIEKFNNMTQAMQGIDLVVINSGIGFLNPELDWSKEQQTLDVNVYGFCALAGEVYKFFARQRQGHIVGISSIGALRGNPIAPAYNASKAFMSNYLEGLRKKAFQEKLPIIVTDIKPGFVDTDMAKGEGKFWVATPQKAAKQIYSAINKQKQCAYITHRWRLIGWALKLMPNWLYQRVG
ncbi:MAG: SDR family NAD(P)-dependent oxidoreductase [Chlamydiae bacterium]|nr:SDR family NAD(P)-dependent oxidoreductase [Chlamydiota bacterium]